MSFAPMQQNDRMAMLADLLGDPNQENMQVSRGMVQADPMQAQQARTAVPPPVIPQNYVQRGNNAPIDLGPSQGMQLAQNSLPLDYSQAPVEFGGQKGYRVKGDPFTVVMQDGTKLSLGNDMAATRARQLQDIQMQKAMADLAHTQEQVATSKAARGQKEGIPGAGIPQATLEKQYGKAPEGKRWTASGGVEDLPGGVKQSDAQSVIELATEAEKVLPNAHGSGVGNLIGGAANFLGIPLEKNNADAQLKVLAGGLVSKMPKMSGPQSDKDVLLYREMAGQVGDATLPIETRTAALQMVKKINEKYAGSAKPGVPFEDRMVTTSIPPAAIVHLKTNPQTRAQFDEKYGSGASSQFLGK